MKKPQFNKKFVMYVPDQFIEMVQRAAERKYMAKSDYIRQAIVEKLERDGSFKEREAA